MKSINFLKLRKSKKAIKLALPIRLINFRSRKAITPIIAIILLLMMTVAAAGAAFFWLTRIQGQLQGGTESYQGRVFEGMASDINVIDADYGTSAENLTVFMHNIGNRRIPINKDSISSTALTTTWILRDPDSAVVCATDWSGSPTTQVNCASGCGTANSAYIEIGQIRLVSLTTASTNCDITSYGSGKAFTFTVDLSGKTTTSGSFIS